MNYQRQAKELERRVCRDMGLTRRGQVTAGGWAKGCDNDDTGPVSVEIKYTARHQLPKRWIEQARANGESDGRPWFLIQGEHRTGRPTDIVAVMDYDTFLVLYRAAFAPLGAGKPGFGTPATTLSRSGL